MTNIEKQNNILGTELGWNQYGEPIFGWSWSDDLFWPAKPTGRMVPQKTAAGIVAVQSEYVRMPMTSKRGCWIVTKWIPPQALDSWEECFPGAPRPTIGVRIPTNQHLNPGLEPTEDETRQLIWAIRKQGAKTRGEIENEMKAELQVREIDAAVKQEDEIEDLIPAFLNHEPGKRGNRVSMPITKQDKLSDGSLN
jgi:hypothetical protein